MQKASGKGLSVVRGHPVSPGRLGATLNPMPTVVTLKEAACQYDSRIFIYCLRCKQSADSRYNAWLLCFGLNNGYLYASSGDLYRSTYMSTCHQRAAAYAAYRSKTSRKLYIVFGPLEAHTKSSMQVKHVGPQMFVTVWAVYARAKLALHACIPCTVCKLPLRRQDARVAECVDREPS